MKYNIIKSHQTLYDKYAIEPVFYFNKREGVLGAALYLTDIVTVGSPKGYDERFPENILENHSILLEIIKNIERLRKIRHLESIQHACDEIKIQAVKDLSDDIRPISITNGGLFNDWLVDQEFDS